MDLQCPYCGVRGGLGEIHRHLLDAHLDQVLTDRTEQTGRMEYALACPCCPVVFRRQVKPRGRNPHFLEEFKAEIALVAFDQLLYHLLQEHPAAVGIDPADLPLES